MDLRIKWPFIATLDLMSRVAGGDVISGTDKTKYYDKKHLPFRPYQWIARCSSSFVGARSILYCKRCIQLHDEEEERYLCMEVSAKTVITRHKALVEAHGAVSAEATTGGAGPPFRRVHDRAT